MTENTKGLDKILTLILMILMLTSASTLAYVAMMPTQGEKFTEFYILGPDGLADNYPTTKFAGDNCTVTAGIINHEYRVVNYTLLVESDNATLLQRDIKLNHNRTWNQPINYVLGNPGNKKELKFLLYYEGNFSKPYRELHLWVEPMYSKKIVIRDDDIWSMSYSLKWFTNLILEKGLKVTYAVIPGRVMTQPDTIHFLDSLDKKRFELATHGYLDSDNNKEKALFNLGYHSISSDRASDVNFTWEYYGNSKVTYRNFTEFKNYFDKFYNSSGEFFVMLLHDNAWVDQSGELNETVIEDFERSMDYVKSKKHIEFMTIEEQYQWTHGKR